jgi:hypothetical protein
LLYFFGVNFLFDIIMIIRNKDVFLIHKTTT